MVINQNAIVQENLSKKAPGGVSVERFSAAQAFSIRDPCEVLNIPGLKYYRGGGAYRIFEKKRSKAKPERPLATETFARHTHFRLLLSGWTATTKNAKDRERWHL